MTAATAPVTAGGQAGTAHRHALALPHGVGHPDVEIRVGGDLVCREEWDREVTGRRVDCNQQHKLLAKGEQGAVSDTPAARCRECHLTP